MCQIVVNIDRDTFEHALNNLSNNEIIGILDTYDVTINKKQNKHELIRELLKMAQEGMLNENLYLSIKTKAFSINTDFYDGFFYKYNQDGLVLTKEKFDVAVKKVADSSQSNTRYDVYGLEYDHGKNYMIFTVNKVSRKAVYDSEEDRSRFYNQQVQARVEIFNDIGLVYIHSKNASEGTTIKTFIQKVLKVKENLVNDKTNIKLLCPKFNNEIIGKWLKENNLNNIGISPVTINMLDFLLSFNREDGVFRGFCMKRIYFEHEVIETKEEDCTITGAMFDGTNLQKHQDILNEIIIGKKIRGFSIEAEHCFFDEDENEICSTLPINITHETNQSVRISISSESLSTRPEILTQAYSDVKNLFLEKLNSDVIVNSDELLEFISKISDKDLHEHLEVKKIEEKNNEGTRMSL